MLYYVRNLAPNTSEAEVRIAFEAYAPVSSVTMLKHETTDAPLGVAVVEMSESHEYNTLNAALVGVQIDGQDIRVGPPRAPLDRRKGDDRRVNGRQSRERRAADRRVVQISDYR